MILASPRLIRKRPFICFSLALELGDRQRGCGRNEQKRGNERAGEDGGGFTNRSERAEHREPLLHSSGPTIGPVPLTMQGACQFRNVVVFQCSCTINSRLHQCRSPKLGKFRREAGASGGTWLS